MSTFELAIPTILRQEGRFVNNPADPGGATNFGISLRWLVANNLLSVLEREEGDVTQSALNAVKSMTQGEAESFYRVQWWGQYGYGRILEQSVATKIFDTAVNIGPRTAHRIAQEAAGAVADGVLGADSIMALNAQKGSPLLIHALQDRQMAYYNALVARNPHLEEFLVGWRARAYDRI